MDEVAIAVVWSGVEVEVVDEVAICRVWSGGGVEVVDESYYIDTVYILHR